MIEISHLSQSSSVAAGQVISRLKLNFWGKRGTALESSGAFQRIVLFVTANVFLMLMLNGICSPYYAEPGVPAPLFIAFLSATRTVLVYVFWGISIIIVWNLRSHIRNMSAIPESCNTGCDDLMCAVCCNHCVVAQLLRHTTDYETYNATCCSETGVPKNAPSIV